MSYEVLARKWRPAHFAQMVGQEAVVRALRHALEQDRLHHAYLFTGTRGVGKTTVARILARCLNCEQGVGPEPCDTCSSCEEIRSGRFPDLIEVDAASRTKVEDTRELLENVQYTPSRGRFKIYLVDEVHMLSGHSFNALLKTLEEPPEHVKFLLATTDPQKLPPTVLSRCLQFHLRHVPAQEIARYLQSMLADEKVSAEPGALQQLAAAAQGSVRDAISLTDQAIAHGGGRLVEQEVREMLGAVDRGRVMRLLGALVDGDGRTLLQEVQQLSELCPDYEGVLRELLGVLHRMAVLQAVPELETGDEEESQGRELRELARRLSPEQLQLFYQAGVIGRRDFYLAPDPRSSLEMALLRMLSFLPATRAAPLAGEETPGASTAEQRERTEPVAAPAATEPAAAAATEPAASQPEPPSQPPQPEPAETAAPVALQAEKQPQGEAAEPAVPAVPEPAASAVPEPASPAVPEPASPAVPEPAAAEGAAQQQAAERLRQDPGARLLQRRFDAELQPDSVRSYKDS